MSSVFACRRSSCMNVGRKVGDLDYKNPILTILNLLSHPNIYLSSAKDHPCPAPRQQQKHARDQIPRSHVHPRDHGPQRRTNIDQLVPGGQEPARGVHWCRLHRREGGQIEKKELLHDWTRACPWRGPRCRRASRRRQAGTRPRAGATSSSPVPPSPLATSHRPTGRVRAVRCPPINHPCAVRW
jgi:hypothetical protein